MTFKTVQRLLYTLFIAAALFPSTTSAQAFSESFDDITTLPGKGWVMINNSAGVGSTSWFQGSNIAASGPFDAYNGAANAYIAANYNNTGNVGTISSWLIMPQRLLKNGDTLKFYTRKVSPDNYGDRLELRLSKNGNSTNVSTPGAGVGDFNTLVYSVNPNLVLGVYPTVWTQYNIVITGLTEPTEGRLAFRYYVTNAGLSGVNGDYIGIDQVDYRPYQCRTVEITQDGLPLAIAGAAYETTLTATGTLGAAKFSATGLPPGLSINESGVISGTPSQVGVFDVYVRAIDASGCETVKDFILSVDCSLTNPITVGVPELICSASGPVTLSASPAGGTFSGTGVVGNQFSSTVHGNHTVKYSYTTPEGCSYEKFFTVTVTDNSGTNSVSPLTQTVCSDPIDIIWPESTNPLTEFSWTRDNVETVTGIDESGAGPITGTFINTTGNPVTVTFTITPKVGECVGSPLTAVVIVNSAPTIEVPDTVFANADILTCSKAVSYSNLITVTGAPVPSLSYEFSGATSGTGAGTASGELFFTGTTHVTITATNSCGTVSKTFPVVVKDVEAPSINSVPENITVSSASEVPAADITLVDATDRCTTVTITHEGDVISNQTCDDKYSIVRTYKATDEFGNFATATQTITVDDNIAPVIDCPQDIIVNAIPGVCAAEAFFNVTATDNSGRTVTITTSHASGSSFEIGTTTVTVTAVDACGNESTCTFNVTVVDQAVPVVSSLTSLAVCTEAPASISVVASNTTHYQWQVWNNNQWQDVQGANEATLSFESVTLADNGKRYRVMLQGPCTVVYSGEIALTVNNLPAPVITVADNICLDERSVVLTANPGGGSFEGPGVNGSFLNLEALPVGQTRISYTYTDVNGCTASATKYVSLGVCDDGKTVLEMTAYPNPTSGVATLKVLVTQGMKWIVSVSDLSGKVVAQFPVPMREGWNTFPVDLNGRPGGIYIVSLIQDGKRRAEVKVMKN